MTSSSYLFSPYPHHRHLHSFPTRRSSDLVPQYLDKLPVNQQSQPSFSSWGYKGYCEVWLEGSNDWIYRHLHEGADRMVELADRKSTRLNSSHTVISYAVFCLKKKTRKKKS